jgi:deoxyribonuclease-4
MLLGAHESISGRLSRAVEHGIEDGCECIQIFTKNQTQWKDPEIDEAGAAEFIEARTRAGIRTVLSHDSYLVNLASDNAVTRRKSLQSLFSEMERCERLGVDFLVMHPGSHMNQGEKRGLALVAQGLGRVLGRFPRARTRILLEITAGQGTSLGCTFEQLAWIMRRAPSGRRLGVCFDTAHAFAAGYDFRTRKSYRETFAAFDRIIGLGRLMAFHLNDSKKDLGSRVDRHEHIGKGFLGPGPFRMLLRDRVFRRVPAVLETPAWEDGSRGFRQNLACLRRLGQGSGRKNTTYSA